MLVKVLVIIHFLLLFICTSLNEVKMVNFCIAIGCTNHGKPGWWISSHACPRENSELLQKWIQAVKRKIWVPNKYSLICSDHFEPSCFVVRPGKVGCRLHENSVPTIFPSFPAHYQKEQRKRKLPMKRVYVSPQKSCEPSPSKVAKVVGSEQSYANTTDNADSEVKQLKKTVKILKQKLWWQKNWKHWRAHENPKRQTISFKSTTQSLRP